MSENRLCATCEDIISKGPNEIGQKKEHHTNDKAFLQAVEQGCYVCTWAWRNYTSLARHSRRSSHIVHHTTYKWEDAYNHIRICDLLESALMIVVYDTADKILSAVLIWLLEPAIEGEHFSNSGIVN
jgi:hypothetical protein